MKKLIVRMLVFAIMVLAIVKINLWVFHSSIPSFWGITLVLSILVFIFFPYQKFFKIDKDLFGK